MGKEKEPLRIIVKKRKRDRGGHHGGAWKVAYADFVTAMMALFIVLWIVAQNNAVKNAIAVYFKDPGVFTEGRYAGGILPDNAKPGEPAPDTSILKAEGQNIEAAIAAIPEFDKFKDKIQITVTEEGLRIELSENAEGLFFDVGSARMKGDAARLLKMIAGQLGKLPNKVIVEGYADARPYVSAGYTNWELSADRANAARKIMEEGGLTKRQVEEVRAYGDRNLKFPDKPYDHTNRRVNILVTMPVAGR